MKQVWHRALDGWWYATLRESGRRQQVKLLKAPNTNDGKKRAEDQLVRELAARIEQGVEPEGGYEWVTVAHVIAGFLAHSAREHHKDSVAWYRIILNAFSAKHGMLRLNALGKQQVMAFVRGRYTNPTSQNRAIGAIKRAFNWAVEEEHISRNPIAHVRKPTSRVRNRVLSPAERTLMLNSIRDQPFADYFLALSLTGCRPSEVSKVTAALVQLDKGIWVLPEHKTAKRTGRPRIVYLSPEALDLTRRLVLKYPEGPIFRNRYGQPWSCNAVRLRFRTLRRRFPELKGVVAYTLRSTFATDALEAGVSDTAVAELLGHTNTDTLHKFYARLSHRVDHLRDAAAKATNTSMGYAAQPVIVKMAANGT